MNHALDRLRMQQLAAEPPPMEAMLDNARATLHRRRRLRSFAGSAAGLAVAALAVLAPSAVRGPGAADELNGQLCAPSVCTAWCPAQPSEPDGPALCGLHEVACLAEGCGNG